MRSGKDGGHFLILLFMVFIRKIDPLAYGRPQIV